MVVIAEALKAWQYYVLSKSVSECSSDGHMVLQGDNVDVGLTIEVYFHLVKRVLRAHPAFSLNLDNLLLEFLKDGVQGNSKSLDFGITCGTEDKIDRNPQLGGMYSFYVAQVMFYPG
ncbi:hypothetical protein V1524DRAFT_410707 [Lipomyces starkeyi]